jgi:Histidine phosphatase superfamily (branch 1)
MKWSVCLALFISLAWAQPDASLVRKLQQGGYVLYLRHTSTDFSQNDARMTSYEDCATQRNLTDKGREEARMINQHVKRLGIPIGPVHASPFCRTMETARLAFGKAQATNDVRGGPVRTDDPTRYDPLRKLLGTRPPAGQNAVISSHGNPFHAVFGPPYLAEGEIAVVDPASGKVIGRVRLEDWPAL